MKNCKFSSFHIGDRTILEFKVNCSCGLETGTEKHDMMYLGHEDGEDVFSFEPPVFCPKCGIQWSYRTFPH